MTHYLNKSESAAFNFWILHIFPKDPLSDSLEIKASVHVPCGGSKSRHVYRFSVVIFTFSGPLEL